MKKLYDKALQLAEIKKTDVVIDAYCGVGTIGLYLAHMANEVIGIENNAQSVIAANANAMLNKINNAKFYEGDVTTLLPKMIEEGTNFDVIVLDPPRTGLTEECIDTLLNSNVKRIIYVSCNPSTLARNLEALSVKYNVNSITPVDMFPQTAHVESVVLLNRIEPKK